MNEVDYVKNDLICEEPRPHAFIFIQTHGFIAGFLLKTLQIHHQSERPWLNTGSGRKDESQPSLGSSWEREGLPVRGGGVLPPGEGVGT